MTLAPEDRNEIVTLRLDNAQNAIEDAELLFENGSLRSAVNRTFYSMFYTVSALAIADGKSFKKHRQVLAFFHKEYAQPEIFDRKHARALQKAFEDRTEADYQDYIHITAEQVHIRIQEARELLTAVNEYLASREQL